MGNFKTNIERFWSKYLKGKSWPGHDKGPQISLRPGFAADETSLEDLEPCHILWKNGIPVVVWLGTVVGLYRFNAVIGDIHLLVQDVRLSSNFAPHIL